MNTIVERIDTLCVRDVMSTDTVVVDQKAPLERAAEILKSGKISGAPVVDDWGNCVGLLTAFDFVRHYVPERVEATTPPRDTVADNMSSGVKSITKNAALLDAAREMCAAHIHRLPVLDARGKVQGVITSLDVVAAVVNAADEHGQRYQSPPARQA